MSAGSDPATGSASFGVPIAVPSVGPSVGPGRLPWWAALPAAALGGFLLDIASPALAWWPAAFFGVALVLLAVWQQRPGIAAGLGAVAGAAFWGPHIFWLTLYLGPVPWLGLCAIMVAWFALFGLVAGFTTRGLARIRGLASRPLALIAAQSLGAAGLWVAREQLQGSWPYGGFAWGRLAHTQSGGPLEQAVSWLGFAGLSGAIAFACALPVAAWFAGRGASRGSSLGSSRGSTRGSSRGSSRALAGLAGGVAVALLALLAVVPAAPLQQTGTLRVAAVQGNSKSGIFDDRENGDVIRAHFEATDALLDGLEARGERVDVIVWPENSAEFEIREDALNDFRLQDLAERADAPIVVGSVLHNPDGTYTNSSLVWTAEGEAPLRYDKRYPVPFAEYMPNRDFFHALAPELVDLVQLEYAHGSRPPVFSLDTPAGTMQAGLAICFDIIFDQQATAMVGGGAEAIFAQTNNADFGRTDESAQQLAIARLRGIETGRALVNISTVGTSAVVAPDGRTLDALTPFTADALVAEIPLVTGETPALRFGAAIAAAWLLLAAAAAAAAAASAPRRR